MEVRAQPFVFGVLGPTRLNDVEVEQLKLLCDDGDQTKETLRFTTWVKWAGRHAKISPELAGVFYDAFTSLQRTQGLPPPPQGAVSRDSSVGGGGGGGAVGGAEAPSQSRPPSVPRPPFLLFAYLQRFSSEYSGGGGGGRGKGGREGADCEWPSAEQLEHSGGSRHAAVDASRRIRRQHRAFLMTHLKSLVDLLSRPDPSSGIPFVPASSASALDLLVSVGAAPDHPQPPLGARSAPQIPGLVECCERDTEVAARLGFNDVNRTFRPAALASGVGRGIMALRAAAPPPSPPPGASGGHGAPPSQNGGLQSNSTPSADVSSPLSETAAASVPPPFHRIAGHGLMLHGVSRCVCKYSEPDATANGSGEGAQTPAGRPAETPLAGAPNDAGLEDVSVDGCRDATVYLLGAFRNAAITDCSHATIVVGAVSGMLVVSRCQRCTVVAACGGVAIAAGVDDCTLSLSCTARPAVLGRGKCTLAPVCAGYPTQRWHRAIAGCPAGRDGEGDRWADVVVHPTAAAATHGADDGKTPGGVGGGGGGVGVMSPEHFHEVAVPFGERCVEYREGLRPEYREQLEGAEALARQLTQVMTSPTLEIKDEVRREFAEQLERRFLEWLQATGNDKVVDRLLWYPAPSDTGQS